jgi:hypothetical protein
VQRWESMRIYTVSLGAGHSYTGNARTWIGNTLAPRGATPMQKRNCLPPSRC